MYFQIPIKTHEEFINFEIDLLFASPIISAMADRGKKRGRGKKKNLNISRTAIFKHFLLVKSIKIKYTSFKRINLLLMGIKTHKKKPFVFQMFLGRNRSELDKFILIQSDVYG